MISRVVLFQDYMFSFNSRTKLKKGLISYYKTCGITYLKIHVDANQLEILRIFFGKEINSVVRGKLKKQPAT
jgi:hypothetical protein